MTSVWDDPDLRVGGDYFKFERPGDSIVGTVNGVRAHRFDDGSVAPQLLVTTDNGDEYTVTAGQIRLKTALAEQRPEAGDRISITYTQSEPRAGGKTLKHFDVKVARGAGQPAQPQTQQAPVQAPDQAAAAGQQPPAGQPQLTGQPAGQWGQQPQSEVPF